MGGNLDNLAIGGVAALVRSRAIRTDPVAHVVGGQRLRRRMRWT
jgi:hypothetical protein